MKWTAVLLPTLLATWLLAGGVATAQAPAAGEPITPIGEPQAGGELRDPDFGVGTRQFGLDRRVEMYQWSAANGSYHRVWNPALIDSTGFEPGHENPPEMPLESGRWWAAGATLDGKPLAPEVLRSLGRWQAFRPGFSRLPGNLAATFQPEGDGLGSAENPLDPQIGDLRLSWRELVLPPLSDQVELRDGVWHPVAAREGSGMAMASNALPGAGSEPRWWPWLLLGLLLLLLLVVGRAVRRRKADRQR